jgi:hypothetical protein
MGCRYALLDITGPVGKYNRVPGSPIARNLGWWQAFNGPRAGNLHPINFSQSLLLPEFQGATGGALWLKPDLNWTLTNYDYPTNGFSLTTGNGLCNFALGESTNWINPPATALEPNMSSGAVAIQLPQVSSGNVLTLAPGGDVHPFQVPSTKFGDWSLMMSAIQLAAEIAQQACMYNASETSEDFGSVTGAQLCFVSTGVARYANIDYTVIPDRSDLDFGATGVPFLGYYSWYYEGYYGPLQYINSTNVYSIPEMPTATGLYVILKPGVVMNVTLGVNEFVTTSTITSLGEINFAAGVVAGLTY